MNIRFLHKQGHSMREIARRTGHSRDTVRKLLRTRRAPSPVSRRRVSKLDDYKPYLTEHWRAHGLTAVRLLPEIRAQSFTGSTQIVRRFLHELKAAHQPDPSLTVPSRRHPVSRRSAIEPRSAAILSPMARACAFTPSSWCSAN